MRRSSEGVTEAGRDDIALFVTVNVRDVELSKEHRKNARDQWYFWRKWSAPAICGIWDRMQDQHSNRCHRVNLLTLLGRHRRLSDDCLQFICSCNKFDWHYFWSLLYDFSRFHPCCTVLRPDLNIALRIESTADARARALTEERKIETNSRHVQTFWQDQSLLRDFFCVLLTWFSFVFCFSFLSLYFSFPMSVIWPLASQL